MQIIGTRRSYVEGMTVPGVDVLLGPDGLEELLRESDVVVLAAPSTPETVDMIDAKALAMMKEQSVLINVGRGSLVDEPALVDALSSGHLRAAVVDVVREEPCLQSSPLWDVPTCTFRRTARCPSTATSRTCWNSFSRISVGTSKDTASERCRRQCDLICLISARSRKAPVPLFASTVHRPRRAAPAAGRTRRERAHNMKTVTFGPPSGATAR